jgi:rhodanese-related sulfurtransferase
VTRLIAGLTPYPAYYAHMGPLNRHGPGPADLSPPEPVDADELRTRIEACEWAVDLRDRRAYAAEHVHGTIGIALGDEFTTYLGWLIPWDTPLTLVGTSSRQVADAQRQLVRIGIDRPAGAAIGSPAELARPDELRTYPTASFTDLHVARDSGDRPVVLDVRRDDERAGGAIPGSAHMPLNELPKRLGEVPDGLLWVHCASGFRAGIAASLLARAGHNVVLVDDDYSIAVSVGLATG